MLRNWEAEKKNLVDNYDRLRLRTLRKRLKGYWRVAGKTVEEIGQIDGERKNKVVMELYRVYVTMEVGERVKRELLEKNNRWGK